MKKILIISFLLFLGIIGNSQTKDTTLNPLEKFFQENYDSTIFYHSYNVFENKPDFYIIGKKNDTIYYYHYSKIRTQQPTKLVGPYKSGLVHFFIRRHNNNTRLGKIQSKIELDDSFYWIHREVSEGSIWEKIQSENIWNFIDDNNPILSKEVFKDVIDGRGCYFRLITNDNVTSISYWNPDVYPLNTKNHIRNRIVEIESILSNFYKNHEIKYIF